MSDIKAGNRPSLPLSQPINNTDWLKVAAIILVSIDHTGYFFIENAQWWSVFGRLAAPVFFFLMGFAQSHKIPFRWIILGVFLTLLDSWNNEWAWVAPNILLSFALIRFVRPYVQISAQKYGWGAFVFFHGVLIALIPFAGNIADYGAEGWLWALFGFYQRTYVNSVSNAKSYDAEGNTTHLLAGNINAMRFLSCLTTALAYLWAEQLEYNFAEIHLAVFIFTVGVLCVALCLFRRTPSGIQPPIFIATSLRFISRYTLEIYAIQLAGFEIITLLFPSLSA